MAEIGVQSYDKKTSSEKKASGKSHLVEYSASASATAELSSTQVFSVGMNSKICASIGSVAATAGLTDATTLGAKITTTYASPSVLHQNHALGNALGNLSLLATMKTTGLTQMFTSQSWMGYRLSTRGETAGVPVPAGGFGSAGCSLTGSSLNVTATDLAAAKAKSGMTKAKAAAVASGAAMTLAVAGFSFPGPQGSKFKGNVCPDAVQTSLVAVASAVTFLLPAITMLTATKSIQGLKTPNDAYNGPKGYGAPNRTGIRMDVSAIEGTAGFSGKSISGDVSMLAGRLTEYGVKLSKTGNVKVLAGDSCEFSVGNDSKILMSQTEIVMCAGGRKISLSDGTAQLINGGAKIVITPAAIDVNGTQIAGGAVAAPGMTNVNNGPVII